MQIIDGTSIEFWDNKFKSPSFCWILVKVLRYAKHTGIHLTFEEQIDKYVTAIQEKHHFIGKVWMTMDALNNLEDQGFRRDVTMTIMLHELYFVLEQFP